MIAAPKPKVAKKMATIDAEKVRLRNRWSGMIGSVVRLSTITKMTRNTRPTRIQPQTDASPQLPLSAKVKPRRIGTRARTSVTTPR